MSMTAGHLAKKGKKERKSSSASNFK